jgi:HD-GYP domain-containing protein (c-di-GMP phosphodiesterase class II)
MTKITIPPLECIIGDVLAQDIYRAGDRNSLIPENTIISETIKNRLLSYDIEKISVYRDDNTTTLFTPNNGKRLDVFKKEYTRAMNSARELLTDVMIGKPLERDKTETIVESLFAHAEENYSLVSCLITIKDMDNYLYTHSVNVSVYALIMAKWMHMSNDMIKDVVRAGLLHDFGKSKIPPAILNKKEQLTPLEHEIIRQHPAIGYNVIKDLPWLSTDVKEAVLAHHEREDGNGYPYGLRAKDIPKYAKIVAIADVYDAMTSNTTYRHRATPFDTFKEFERIGIGNFDVRIMHTFLANLAQHYVGSKARLNTGETGEIVFISPQSISTPIVKVGVKYYDLYHDKEHKIEEIL